MQHQVAHGDMNVRFAAFSEFLVVFTHAPIAAQPSECSFDDPTMRQYFEAFHIIRSLDDFQYPATQLLRPFDQLACIPAVCPNEFQEREFACHSLEQKLRAIAILNIRRVHHDRNQHAHDIHCDVSLASLYFLARVITPDPFFSVVFTD